MFSPTFNTLGDSGYEINDIEDLITTLLHSVNAHRGDPKKVLRAALAFISPTPTAGGGRPIATHLKTGANENPGRASRMGAALLRLSYRRLPHQPHPDRDVYRGPAAPWADGYVTRLARRGRVARFATAAKAQAGQSKLFDRKPT